MSHTHTLHSGPAHHALSRRDSLNGGAQVNSLYELYDNMVAGEFQISCGPMRACRLHCMSTRCGLLQVFRYCSSISWSNLFFLLYSPVIYGSSSNLNFQLFFEWFVEHRTKVTCVLTWETSDTEIWCGLKVEIYKTQSSSTICYSKLKACFRRECKASSVFNDQQGNGSRCHEMLAVEALLEVCFRTGDGWVWLETWICWKYTECSLGISIWEKTLALIFRRSKFLRIAVFENFISWMCCSNMPRPLLMSFLPARCIHVVEAMVRGYQVYKEIWDASIQKNLCALESQAILVIHSPLLSLSLTRP